MPRLRSPSNDSQHPTLGFVTEKFYGREWNCRVGSPVENDCIGTIIGLRSSQLSPAIVERGYRCSQVPASVATANGNSLRIDFQLRCMTANISYRVLSIGNAIDDFELIARGNSILRLHGNHAKIRQRPRLTIELLRIAIVPYADRGKALQTQSVLGQYSSPAIGNT